MNKCLNWKSRMIVVRLKVNHLNEIFLKKYLRIKTENEKYLRFRVFQKNSSFFKIIQNPVYSEHCFSKSANELLFVQNLFIF
jgi:hypothetical protein